jgi:three-Cys-motif partner protein
MNRASDGHVARDSGHWAKVKLSFLDFYCPTALVITRKFPERHYIDLFAGPGKNIDRETGEEFDGSPLRVLRSRAKTGTTFTHAVFVNMARRDHDALERRVNAMYDAGEAVIPRENVRLILGDANVALPEILRSIHPLSYILIFADIEAPRQWPWASVEAMKAGGHRSVDLYLLFPIDMGLVRLAGYSEADRERWAPVLTPFFGTEEWKGLADELRVTSEQSPAFRRALVDLYLSRLRGLWEYSVSVLGLKRRGDQILYEMLFASNAKPAAELQRWAQRKMRELGDAGQIGLL